MRWLVIIPALLFASAPFRAHHKLLTAFDASKPVTLRGEVSRVEWFNPHPLIFINVKSASGQIESWRLEGDAPAILVSRGWEKTTLKPGDLIEVFGYLPTNRRVLMAGGATIQLPTGRTLRFSLDPTATPAR